MSLTAIDDNDQKMKQEVGGPATIDQEGPCGHVTSSTEDVLVMLGQREREAGRMRGSRTRSTELDNPSTASRGRGRDGDEGREGGGGIDGGEREGGGRGEGQEGEEGRGEEASQKEPRRSQEECAPPYQTPLRGPSYSPITPPPTSPTNARGPADDAVVRRYWDFFDGEFVEIPPDSSDRRGAWTEDELREMDRGGE